MTMTINMGTLSQTRALIVSCLLTGLIVYTLSSRFQSPSITAVAPAPSSGGSSYNGIGADLYGEEIPHGISVFKLDNYKKHLVLPRMQDEDVSWLTYLPPELNITPKTYLVDADLSNPPAGALTTPMNKVTPPKPYLRSILTTTRATKQWSTSHT